MFSLSFVVFCIPSCIKITFYSPLLNNEELKTFTIKLVVQLPSMCVLFLKVQTCYVLSNLSLIIFIKLWMIISSLEKKMIKLRPRISILFNKQYLKELLQPNYTTHTRIWGGWTFLDCESVLWLSGHKTCHA